MALYALGAMLSFTLSQVGMVVPMGTIGRLKAGESTFSGVTRIHHEKGWRWKEGMDFIAATTTGIVFFILVATKFVEGAGS